MSDHLYLKGNKDENKKLRYKEINSKGWCSAVIKDNGLPKPFSELFTLYNIPFCELYPHV